MEEELARMWGNLALNEEENEGISVASEELDYMIGRGSLCLIGKVLVDRFVPKESIKSPLKRAWNPVGEVSFKIIGGNMFVADFELAEDKGRVLEGRPWLVDGSLVSLLEFDGLTPPIKMCFDKSPLWIRMYHLPLACMDKRFGLKIGASVGEVMELDVDDNEPGWGTFLRARICVDITKPLPRGRFLHLDNQSLWIAFKYEKLPKFCFKCGRIIHGKQGCLKAGNSKQLFAGENSQYGPWLKVSFPPKKGKNFHQTNDLPSADFSGSQCSDDSPQTHFGQMVHERAMDSTVPSKDGDKGILGNELESHIVQGPRLEMAVDCDKGDQFLDSRAVCVEDSVRGTGFLPNQSTSFLNTEEFDLQMVPMRLTKDGQGSKIGMDEQQSEDLLGGKVQRGEKRTQLGNQFVVKGDCGPEEKLAQKPMDQGDPDQSGMVWNVLKEVDKCSDPFCNKATSFSGSKQLSQEDVNLPVSSNYSEERDIRSDVPKKRKIRRGPTLVTDTIERRGTDVKRKLIEGSEVEVELSSKKGRWALQDEEIQQPEGAEAGFQPRLSP